MQPTKKNPCKPPVQHGFPCKGCMLATENVIWLPKSFKSNFLSQPLNDFFTGIFLSLSLLIFSLICAIVTAVGSYSLSSSFNVLIPLNVWKLVSMAPEDFTFSICVQSAWKWLICFSFSFRFKIAYQLHFIWNFSQLSKNERVLGEIGKWLNPKWFSTMSDSCYLLLSIDASGNN